jgi:hypothetical protein
LDVFFRFAVLGWLEVRGAADGAAIEINRAAEPEAYDMAESGSVAVVRDTNFPRELGGLVGKQFVDAKWVVSSNSVNPIGVQMRFDQDESVLIINWADNLIVSTTLPESIGQFGGRISE